MKRSQWSLHVGYPLFVARNIIYRGCSLFLLMLSQIGKFENYMGDFQAGMKLKMVQIAFQLN